MGYDAAAGIDPVIVGNIISGGFTSVNVVPGAKPVIEQNTLIDSRYGITLDSSDAIVTGNTIRGHSTVGIQISRGSPTVTGNRFEANGIAVHITAAGTATVTGNTLCGNTVDYKLMRDTAQVPDGNTVCAAGSSTPPSPAPSS